MDELAECADPIGHKKNVIFSNIGILIGTFLACANSHGCHRNDTPRGISKPTRLPQEGPFSRLVRERIFSRKRHNVCESRYGSIFFAAGKGGFPVGVFSESQQGDNVMDNFRRANLERLIGHDESPCVSLFLPTHAVGPNMQQDEIRLKNLQSDAERKLSGHWMNSAQARELLKPVAALPRNTEFWQKRDRGLTVYVAPGFFEAYRLPITLAESVHVSNRFQIRQLLPLLPSNTEFFLLALSQNGATLYRGDERSLVALEVANLPVNMKQALNYDGADRGSQTHTAFRGAAAGKQGAVFHGQGGQRETNKDDLLAYSRVVDRAVSQHIGPSRQPLILASVDYVSSIYRKANSYPHLVDENLSGNPEHADKRQLHQRALQVVTPLLEKVPAQAAARFQNNLGTPKAIEDVREVVRSACVGRVDELWYDPRGRLREVSTRSRLCRNLR